MMPPRRSRGSLPNSPTPADDVAHLTLTEVRDRLARNARVLSSTLFSPSTSPSSTSILAAASAGAGPSRNVNINGNGNGQANAQVTSPDPVRERLMQTREALLAREADLLARGFEGMTMSPTPPRGVKSADGSPVSVKGEFMMAGRRESATGRNSGKQRALDTIRQGEVGLASNAIQLPIDQTLSLGSRDYTTQTIDNFNHLSLSKSVKPNFDPTDENARAQHLARLNHFMGYKGGDDDDFDQDDDDDGGDMFGFEDGEYEGEDDRLASGVRRERGTGERVDEFGEDEEIWREGAADEYTLRGGNLGDDP